MERTLVIQPPATEVTPEIAHRWLRERLGAYIELTSAGALAEDRDTREALHFLVVDVRTIAEACVRSIVGTEPVRIEVSERDGDAWVPTRQRSPKLGDSERHRYHAIHMTRRTLK